MSFLKKSAKTISDFVYKNFEQKGSGNMILLTSLTGIALSSLVQTGAIFVNKKYTTSQKAFMIPQELTEGLITILSTLLIVTPLQKIAKKAVNIGKIRTKLMTNYMKKYNIFEKHGRIDFDFTKNVENIVGNIKNTQNYKNSTEVEQNSLIREHTNVLQEYSSILDATSAIATTAGSVFSTALISPVIRNYSASHFQKINIDAYNKSQNKKRIYNNQHINIQSNYYNPCKI